MKIDKKNLEKQARDIRKTIVEMSYNAQVGHLASALSIVDILVVLYWKILTIYPQDPLHSHRDRFILSKGHAASALYAVLAAKNFFPREWIKTYCKDGGKLGTHPDHYQVPGVEWSTGSLGHGLSVGVGMAMALKMIKSSARVFIIISDAESQEGEIWEAALTAAHHKLDNLIVIVDYNKVQAFGKVRDILNLEPFEKKWKAFGWYTNSVSGHDIKQLYTKIKTAMLKKNKPKIIIAHTIRGKGVPFMHHKINWYYEPLQEHHVKKALHALDNVL